jgi:uncharacterized RDD family membrane protein YckC
MKTIENLKVEKTTYKKETDENGNTVKVPVTKMVVRSPELVSLGVRFGYFLIDIVFLYIIQIIVGVIIGVILGVTGNLDMLEEGTAFRIFLNLSGYLIYFLYYSISEGFGGTSLGKLICGYTVINDQAEKMSFGKAMLRTICRLIPFEAPSCFSERGWHDTLSKTYVVKKSEKIELQKLLGSLSNAQTDILD